jgi:replicative DNA helicase
MGPTQDKQQAPQNLEAEASLLGAILIDADALVKIADAVSIDDFYDPRHGRIYEAILNLYERRSVIDVLTLADQLKNGGFLDMVGGPSYLTELTNFVPTASHVEQYAEIVAQKALRRRLIKASQELTLLGYDESKQLRELIEEAESNLFQVSQKHVKQSIVSLEKILEDSFDRLDELHKDKGKIRGVPTGYRDLDNVLAGLQRSDLIILAARPSMGKTALVLNLAHNVAVQAKEPVLFFSLEMSKEQLVDRLLSMESGVDAWALRTGNLTDQDFEKIGQAMGTLSEAKIYIDDTPGVTVSDMRTKARREAHQHGLGLIIVDYLQLMSGGSKFGGSDNRVQEISEISRGLKSMARELNVPLIALSQLSRSVENRSPQIPQLADLRESGCLAGDTLIYLPENGQYVPIRTLAGKSDFGVASVDPDTYKLGIMPAVHAFRTGHKEVYRLTTRTGRTIRATANHKFLTIQGWRRLDELNLTDHIASPRVLVGPRIAEKAMDKAELALLGHLIGDGCTLPRHAIQYTTKDLDLAENVAALARTVFGDTIQPRIVHERDWIQVYLSAARKLTHGVRNPISTWLEDLNVFGLRSWEKFVPNRVFAQNTEHIATFLRHLWATDGCIRNTPNGYPAIYYASSSERLARDVQSLLLRLHITGRLSKHPQIGKGRDQYHILVSGHQEVLRFIELIQATGQRKIAELEQVHQKIKASTGNTNRDIIPREAWHMHTVPAMRTTGMTTRQLHKGLNTAYSGTTLYRSNISRERTALLATVVQSPVLTNLADSDVYWDRIVSIEPDGAEDVFDLTVPGTHNFVAADIIVHNSIEQDADVVAFIYREEYYNPETENKNIATILIKKHRNGPTDNVDLYFERDKQRFRSLDTKHKDPFIE